MIGGFVNKVVEIDLANEKIHIDLLNLEMARKYIGGKGIATKILWDKLKPNVDPFGPDNILIFATGPLTGTLCPATRMVVVTKSPLTGTFTDSYVGGRFGHELKFAGYDLIVISGKAEKPVLLWIADESVWISDARHLWGKDTFETDKLIKKEYGDKVVSTACIGPAGEKLVRFALISVDGERHAARGGVGAVMGSKNLKAIAVHGSGDVKVADFDAFNKAALEAHRAIVDNELAHYVYKNFGTARQVGFANDQDIYPTRNYQAATFEEAENLSGERQRRDFWVREHACYGCPIACSHIGIARSLRFKGTVVDGVEYECTALLGSMCGVGNLEAVAHANMICDGLGIDALSVGNTIAWAMECYEKGILTNEDTRGLKLTFGNYEAQIDLIKKIASREGLGDLLAEGVRRASEKVRKGSEKFAMHVKGLELPGWGIRGSPGMGLAYATADRGGCHQRAWPTAYEVTREKKYPGGTGERAKTINQEFLDRYSWKGKALVTIIDQNLNASLWTLVACDIAVGKGIGTDSYVEMLNAATGWDFNREQFTETGERIWNLSRAFNVREGFRSSEDTLPPRIFDDRLPSGVAKDRLLAREDFERMLKDYYKLRGWDINTGIPTAVKLRKLGLDDVVNEFKNLGILE